MKSKDTVSNLLGSDGYPTDKTLKKIVNWEIKDYNDALELMEFVKSIWAYADWGFKHKGTTKYKKYLNAYSNKEHQFNISTAGWSGNESIIEALQSNFMFWNQYWEGSRRGGHYTFVIEELKFLQEEKNEARRIQTRRRNR